ncbi:MAG: glycosyltransferase [Desulfuromonadaceae bacterium]|nr:glycosyltransferase [Desulfuromonadaceae bacterium]
MRCALISPYSSGPMRGNIITVQRIARFLGSAGVATNILPVDRYSLHEMKLQLAEFKPDLIHGFHAHYCGLTTRELAEFLHVPYVITITGSDLHDSHLRHHPTTARVMETAQSVICFHNSDAKKLTGFFPNILDKVTVVPQGVEVLPVSEDDRFGIPGDSFVLLLPAALRPVKCVEFPIQALSQLADSDKTVQLIIAGGVIDENYARFIRTLLDKAPFARWLGEVPHEQMGNLYGRADLVLNCSRSESMPNSLMEAMAIGRPVLAADIPGNRSLVQQGKNGWIYDGESDFRKLVMEIQEDAPLREQTGRNAEEYMKKHFSPQDEAIRYLSLYRSLIQA